MLFKINGDMWPPVERQSVVTPNRAFDQVIAHHQIQSVFHKSGWRDTTPTEGDGGEGGGVYGSGGREAHGVECAKQLRLEKKSRSAHRRAGEVRSYRITKEEFDTPGISAEGSVVGHSPPDLRQELIAMVPKGNWTGDTDAKAGAAMEDRGEESGERGALERANK
ncbi:hypothetical protein C8R45DRAFT_1082073 [Mycena sanguinolenta]|nr:hypothetical protein C8R45DRAFT_1082073 [Mycena sanguinolenta]